METQFHQNHLMDTFFINRKNVYNILGYSDYFSCRNITPFWIAIGQYQILIVYSIYCGVYERTQKADQPA